MSTTTAILHRLRTLGWSVSTHRVNGTIEHRAVKLDGSAEPQVSRCNDGDGDEEEYRAVCLLAEACGMDLEDG